MGCSDCRHWEASQVRVCAGSRRVVAPCSVPGGPVVQGCHVDGSFVYDDWRCDLIDPHRDSARLARVGEAVAEQNAALDARYGSPT